MRKWFARLAFSFIILAAVLAWEGYQAMTGRRGAVPPWRVVACFVGAGVLFFLGLRGVRERHRLLHGEDGRPGSE